MGFMDEITCDRVFWSADRAILSLGAPLPETSPLLPLEGKTGLEAGQEITPHEERGERGV
jgi:hypothetical protein